MANVKSIITNSQGNVLINTETDTGHNLSVNGTALFSDKVSLIRSGSNDQLLIKTSSNNGSRIGHDSLGLYFSNDDTSLDVLRIYGGASGALRFSIDSSGVLYLNSGYFAYGDGTFTALYAPDANGGITMGDATGPVNVYYNDTHVFQNAGQLVDYGGFTSTGFGVGTVAPAYKLNVITSAVAGRQNLAAIDRTAQNFVTFTNPQYSVDASMGLMLRVFPQSDSRQGAGIIASGGALNGETDLSLFVSSGVGSSVSYGALNIKGASGNVLIGTTTDAGYKLDVNGTGRFSSNSLTLVNNGSFAAYNAGDGTYASYFGYAYSAGHYVNNSQAGDAIVRGHNGIIIQGGDGAGNYLRIDNGGGATFSSSVTAASLIKSGGTSSQYLMADGSVSTLTNPVTGTGTTNYVPKFTSSSAIGNSALQEVSGNLGLGVTPSAWNTVTAFQVGSTSLGGYSNTGYLNSNAFYQSGWKYINSSYSARYEINASDAGEHRWFTAPSGTAGNAISFTQAMTLTAAGNVGIGNTSPITKLHINSPVTIPNNRYLNFYAGEINQSNFGSSLTVSYTDSTATSQPKQIGVILHNDSNTDNTFSPALVFGNKSTSSNFSAANSMIAGRRLGIQGDTNWHKGELWFWTATGDSIGGADRGIPDGYPVMVMDSLRRVGIGTTNPTGKLHIAQSNSGGVAAILLSEDESTIQGPAANTQIRMGSNLVLGASNIMTFSTNGSEQVRIAANGNVLINTTTDSGYKLSVNGNAYVGGTFYQAGGNYRLGIQIPYPGDNYGNGVIYLRVASSASSRIGSLKIRISATWNWVPAWGYVEATIGFFWTGSAFFAESGTNIISATGYAAYTLNIGQPVEENGYISIPIYSSNSNPIFALVEATPDIDPNFITLSGWSTTTHPGTSDVFIQTELGVGTRSPSARLHVSGGDGIINNAFIGEVPTYTSANAQFSHTSRAGAGEYSFLSANDGETFINSKTGYNIRFRVNNADQVIINSSGNVGIGTTAPYGRLELNGSGQSWTTAPAIRMWDSFNTKGWLVGNVNNITPGDFYIRTLPSVNGNPGTNQQEFTIKHATGAVGIGTTSPDRGLTISKGDQYASINIYKTNTTNQIVYLGTGSSGADDDAILQLFDEATEKVRIFTAGNSWLNGGNVGIGTTSPSASLDVKGVSDTSGAISLQLRSGNTSSNFDSNQITLSYNNTALYRHAIKTRHNSGASSGNAIDFYTWQYGGLDSAIGGQHVMSLDGGNVGVGITSPTATLHVVGTHKHFANIGAGTNLVRVDQYGTDTNYRLDYKQIVSSGLVKHSYNVVNNGIGYDNNLVLDRGNVGIGTASPGYKLQIINNSNAYAFGLNGGAAGLTYYATYLGDGGASLGTRTNHQLAFFTNDSDRMAITTAGNVLIGTTTDGGYKLRVNGEILADDDIRIFNTYALVLNGTDNNWRIGRNTITDSGWLTGNTLQVVVFGGSSGQGFQVVNTNGTALFEIDGVQGYTRITTSLGVGVDPSGTTGRIDASNDIVAYSTSDQRLKENITPIANALDKVKALTGVEFDWKEETKDVHGYEGHDVGVIAQEVQAVLPEAVRINDSGYLSVRYEKMIALLVEANKELAARVEELEKKLK